MFFAKSSKQIESTRVVIIGAGSVGATSAYAILMQGIASEVVLVDINKDKCQGEVWDLEHGLSFMPQARVWAGSYADCREADMVVITAGLKQAKGQSRLELTEINSKIIADIVKNIAKYTKTAIILTVTNPLDVLTYVAFEQSGFPPNQVFGTGTALDSSRFRYLLAQSLGVAADSLGAYLIGEHGDSSVPVYSHANVMGENISSFPGYDATAGKKAYQSARDAAANVIAKKGATFYAIGAVVARITRAVLYDENHVFPVSVYLTGQYGVKDVYMSLPAVVGRTGIKRILDIKLNALEKKRLQKSAKIIQGAIDQIKF
ncbi:L-lactate dehydrogenase [Candidatus Falkowbacteria bacterium CG10_big_fil_rev_8_21_14_0_10_43_11]|uniref:L-lactate dehydrogenase n=1 Tax=Candidatus Falkowbacteria bacterium CG10_big_fil_rev_8_21_14_0_10_43_11 TaxID=1974568 RepID=A0A2M6WKX9_9BACT|nr:MAG: L-lactate dehydrogenase [Candidatus Falkowbacteria bacterium CG10_big_fil_rev_8_21_14_0_10_43_11]